MLIKPKILYVQHEMYTWQHAKMWSHNFHLGIENGFRANGLDFTTLVTSWFPGAKELLKGASFDQVWINDIAQTLRDGGCGGYQLQEEDIEWLSGLAPVCVGFVNETLQYSDEEYAANSGLYELQKALKKSAKYTTHILAVDENDIEFIQSMSSARVMWMVPCMPENFICKAVGPPRITKGLFMGMPYGERIKWLEMPHLKDLLAKHESLDNHTGIPDQFDDLHKNIEIERVETASDIKTAYASYLWELRQMRQLSFTMYLEGMRDGAAVVHLPSYCKVYNSRVYEGMAAGRPVITSRGEGRPRLDRLFEAGRDLFIYPSDDPQMLAKHIRSILDDPDHGAAVAMRARKKLSRFHTTEKRIDQILHWISTDVEPFPMNDEISADTISIIHTTAAAQDAPCVPSGSACSPQRPPAKPVASNSLWPW